MSGTACSFPCATRHALSVIYFKRNYNSFGVFDRASVTWRGDRVWKYGARWKGVPQMSFSLHEEASLRTSRFCEFSQVNVQCSTFN